MLIHAKMTRLVYDGMRADLDRPHPFAHERVGFMFTRRSVLDKGGILLLVTDYLSVPDTQYINDPYVGARINSAAIRNAMEHSLSTKEGILHVHRHEHSGPPSFSRIDRRELGKLIPSFHNLGGNAVHGAMVFSFNSVAGLIWPTKQVSPRRVTKVTIVGYPLDNQTFGGGIYA